MESVLREHGYEVVRGKTNLGLGRPAPAASPPAGVATVRA
jgi:hypothetical protein